MITSRENRKNLLVRILIYHLSLPAKLASCAAAFNELNLNVFLITETFLTERREIKHRIRDFSNEHGVDFFLKTM